MTEKLEEVETDTYTIDLERDVICLGIWMHKNDPDFFKDGCKKFMRWFLFSIFVMGSQTVILSELMGELVEMTEYYNKALELKENNKTEEFEKNYSEA